MKYCMYNDILVKMLYSDKMLTLRLPNSIKIFYVDKTSFCRPGHLDIYQKGALYWIDRLSDKPRDPAHASHSSCVMLIIYNLLHAITSYN